MFKDQLAGSRLVGVKNEPRFATLDDPEDVEGEGKGQKSRPSPGVNLERRKEHRGKIACGGCFSERIVRYTRCRYPLETERV